MSLMIVDPYRFAVSGPPGDVTVAVKNFSSGTSTGVQNITSTTLSGITPTGALIFSVTHNLATPTVETAPLSVCFAFMDGKNTGSSNAHITLDSRDNQASTLTLSDFNGGGFRLSNGAGSYFKSASVTSISDGLSFDFTTNTTYSVPIAYLAIGGADTTIDRGVTALGTGTSAIDVTEPGFEPDALIFFSSDRPSSSTSGYMTYSLGFALNDGSQMCVTYTEEGNLAAGGNPKQAIVTDRGCVILTASTGAVKYSLNITDFDANGFSVTPSASAGSANLGWVAIKTGRRFKIVEFTTPTSTGSANITGAGFTPQAAIVYLTNLESTTTIGSIGTLSTSDLQSGLGVSFIADEAFAFSMRADSGADPTDTASYSESLAILGASATDCEAIKASFTNWTSDGMTVNYSVVQGTGKKGIILFIE